MSYVTLSREDLSKLLADAKKGLDFLSDERAKNSLSRAIEEINSDWWNRLTGFKVETHEEVEAYYDKRSQASISGHLEGLWYGLAQVSYSDEKQKVFDLQRALEAGEVALDVEDHAELLRWAHFVHWGLTNQK